MRISDWSSECALPISNSHDSAAPGRQAKSDTATGKIIDRTQSICGDERMAQKRRSDERRDSRGGRIERRKSHRYIEFMPARRGITDRHKVIAQDRKSVAEEQSVSLRVYLGGSSIIIQKKCIHQHKTNHK